MKFTLLCIGSHGDIRPYIALGIGLKEKGHEVTIASHAKARLLSEKYGLNFKLVEGDLTEMIGKERGHEILWGGKGKKWLQFFSIMKEFKRVLEIQLPASLEASSDADVLIYSPASFAGPHLGEYFSIPSGEGVTFFIYPPSPNGLHFPSVKSLGNRALRVSSITNRLPPARRAIRHLSIPRGTVLKATCKKGT